jgi:hypothetical protein
MADQVFYLSPYLVIQVMSVLLILFFLLLIARKIVRIFGLGRRHFKHKLFLIRLPKEKPKDENKETTPQQLKEEIARGETIFASIGGLRAGGGFLNWFLGRDDHFSFEIVAEHGKIYFYAVAPERHALYLEKQINAYYPEAVLEEVLDYNAFTPNGFIAGAYLKTKNKFVLSLKTYEKMLVDPLNSIINILSKLDRQESIAIQYVVRSAPKSWHRASKRSSTMINRSGSVWKGLRASNPFWSMFYAIFPPTPPSQKSPQANGMQTMKYLTAVEQDMLKMIEEKNLKAGLEVNLRIIACAENKEKANYYLENLSNAYNQYNNYNYGNNFSGIYKGNQKKIINDFIYRRFKSSLNFLLGTEELTSLYHLPLKGVETPNIVWLTSKMAPAPATLPEEGISLGQNVYRGVKREVRIRRDDRRRHTYIVGKSGVGKSVLLANMAVQDIQNGEGVCVIDPHGDLISDILDRIPPERVEDVIVFSPGDLERPMALNLLEYDPKYPEQKSFVINEMIGIFDKLYDLKATGGPMFEQYMRNAMLLIMDDPESGSTLMEIPKVLSDEEFRKLKLSRCKNQPVVDFWRKEAEKAGGEAALANIVPYITSKLTSFISNDMMRPIIGQQQSAFNMREVMDKQKILLIDLPKGVVGEMNTYLLGMILVGKILIAALSRTDIPSSERKDFYLYIDEFQNFTTNSICQILSEARKYALNLVIAHQYIGQLSKNNNTEIKDAVFGNVGTMVSFKIGSEDAEFLVKEFAPVFNEYDLINIDKGMACLKLLIDNSAARPFTLKTIWPLLGVKRPEIAAKARSLSRLKYGQNNLLVEAEIKRRTSIIK